MALVRNVTNHAVDTSSGGFIPAKELGVVNIILEHEQRLLAEGSIQVVDYDVNVIPEPGEPDPTVEPSVVTALLDAPAEGDLLARGEDGVFQAVRGKVTFIQHEIPNYEGSYIWFELDATGEVLTQLWYVKADIPG